jgi:hypothetical protein
MPASMIFSNDTELYVSTVLTGHTIDNTFKLPIHSGYSATPSKSVVDVEIEEMGVTGKRGRDILFDSLDPVEFSFSIYSRSYDIGNGEYKAIDSILWEALLAQSMTSHIMGGFITTGNVIEVPPVHIYFVNNNIVYLLEYAYIGTANITMAIDDIMSNKWEGKAMRLKRNAVKPSTYTNISNVRMVKNKPTTVEVSKRESGTDRYLIAITEGSITIDNNLQILAPKYSGIVNKPVGSVVGVKSISGSLTAYLRIGTSATHYKNLEDLLFYLYDSTNLRERWELEICVGGKNNRPRIEFMSLYGHINVPDISFDQVASTTITFNSIGSSADTSDELKVYFLDTNSDNLNDYHPVLGVGDIHTAPSEVKNSDGLSILVSNTILSSNGQIYNI